MNTSFFKPVIFYKPLAAIAGALGAIILSQSFYYESQFHAEGVLFFNSYKQWDQDTSLSPEEIDSTLPKLAESGVIEFCKKEQNGVILVGIKVNHDVLECSLSGKPPESQAEKAEKKSISPALSITSIDAGDDAEVEIEPEVSQVEVEIIEEKQKIPEKSTKLSPNLTQSIEPGVKFSKSSRPTDEQIKEVFFEAYKQHKSSFLVNHTGINPETLKKIKNLIKFFPENSIEIFCNALTWVRECEDDFWRQPKSFTLDNLLSNGKVPSFSDKHLDAMSRDPKYRARVEGRLPSKDPSRNSHFNIADIQKLESAITSYEKEQEIFGDKQMDW